MSKATFTPGPWELRDEFGMQGLVYPKGAQFPVAAVTGYYNADGQTKGNACLISQAPAMLAVCRAIDAHYSASLDHQPAYVRLARAALAAATGSDE